MACCLKARSRVRPSAKSAGGKGQRPWPTPAPSHSSRHAPRLPATGTATQSSPLRGQPALPAPQRLRRVRKPVKRHAGKDQVEALGQIAGARVGAKRREARYFPLCLAEHRRRDIEARQLAFRPARRSFRQHKARAATNVEDASRLREIGICHQRFRHLRLRVSGVVVAACSLVKSAGDNRVGHRMLAHTQLRWSADKIRAVSYDTRR